MIVVVVVDSGVVLLFLARLDVGWNAAHMDEGGKTGKSRTASALVASGFVLIH